MPLVLVIPHNGVAGTDGQTELMYRLSFDEVETEYHAHQCDMDGNCGICTEYHARIEDRENPAEEALKQEENLNRL